MADERQLELATFGGGCFWCTEAVFQQLAGVETVVSGYAGGQVANPTYEQICTGTTGHAEVIQIGFDPDQISFTDLMEVFYATHDPTTLNQQGADRGTQYRSVVFYHDETQKQLAEELRARLDARGEFGATIVTEITPISEYYPAENYHQNYFRSNPFQPYCNAVIPPKLQKLKDKFADKLKADA